MLSRFVAVTLLWLLAGAAGGRPDATRLPPPIESAIERVSADELRTYVAALASDRFAGRGVGHDGNREAVTYLATALRAAHVDPAAPEYLQPVEVYQPRLGSGGLLTMTTEGVPAPVSFSVGPDFLPLPQSGDAPAAGRIVFAGFGISAPDLKHDDYSGVDARGAVVFALDDAPASLRRVPGLSEEDRDELATVDRKVDDARAHGAAALVIIRSSVPDARQTWADHTSVRAATYRLYAPLRESPLAVAAISEHAAAPVRRALQQHAVHASIEPGVIARPIVINNVLGIVEGRGKSAEMVVVGAHLDHDGIDEDGRIYNGADDNASGTAAVLAMAAAFARAAADGSRPARAIVFALWNGEEKGSLGAEHYVRRPEPARTVVANINLDMVGRDEEIPDPSDPRFRGFQRMTPARSANVVHLLGYTYSPDLARLAERANETIRLTLKEDYDQGAQSLVRRSDNWAFLRHGVPAVFLTTGLHPDYHTPDDDTERIDFPKLERITELASRLAWMAADGEPPRFKNR